MTVRAVCKPHSPDLKNRCSSNFSLLGRAPASRTDIPGSRSTQCDGADPGGGYTYIHTYYTIIWYTGASWDTSRVRAQCLPLFLRGG